MNEDYVYEMISNDARMSENRRMIDLLLQLGIIRRDGHGVIVANTTGVATELEGLELDL